MLSGLLLHMGLGLAPTLAAAKLTPQRQPYYIYTNTPKYLRLKSTSFPISGIMSLQHTDASEHIRLSRTLEHFAVLIFFASSIRPVRMKYQCSSIKLRAMGGCRNAEGAGEGSLKSAGCRPANWRPAAARGLPVRGSPNSMPWMVDGDPEPTPQYQNLPNTPDTMKTWAMSWT